MKTKWIHFSIALAIIAAGAGFLLNFKTHQKLGIPGVKVGPVPLLDASGKAVASQSVLLPENLPGFKSRPAPISAQELAMLPADTTYGRRIYETTNGFAAAVNVVLMGADRTSIHKPEFCLPSQGWRVEKEEKTEIEIAGANGCRQPVMKWTISQMTQDKTGRLISVTGIYAFWFVSGESITVEHNKRVLSMARRLLTKGELERWAYVAYYTICAPGQEKPAGRMLDKLVAESVPYFQTTLPSGARVSAGADQKTLLTGAQKK